VYATAEIIMTSNNYVIIVYSNNEMETNSFLWLQRWVSRSSSIWRTTNNQWLHELADIHFVGVKRIPRILHTMHSDYVHGRYYISTNTHNGSIICHTDNYHTMYVHTWLWSRRTIFECQTFVVITCTAVPEWCHMQAKLTLSCSADKHQRSSGARG